MIRPPQPPLGPAHGRILIAKDDPSLAGLILEQLGTVGYAVEAVSSGEEAISHVRADKPAAVVLDVGLAGRVDGWGVLAALREDASTAEIPVILIAGRGNQEHGLALGVDEFLVKPVPSQRLIGTIRRLAGAPDDRPIIVADDDATNREVVQEILSRAGFNVVAVADGEQALAALNDCDPLALILDLIMPKLDGFGVLEALRSDKRLCELPVLVLTAKDLCTEERDHLRRRTAEVLHRPGGSGIDIAAALLHAIRTAPVPQPVAACQTLRSEIRQLQPVHR